VKRLAAALVTAAAVAIAAGCMGDNSLGGSMSEVFPLDVSRVDILRNDDGFQISYYNNNGNDIDLVARISIALYGLDFQAGKDFPLQGEYDAGHQRAAVLHLAAGEPPRPLPDISLGDLALESGGNVGQPTQGNFSMSFVNDGSYGSGRTLYGNFSGTAQDAGFDDWIP